MNSQQPSEQNQPNQAENLEENLATVGDSLSLENRFPVVGIGASAGGLDAFRKLLSNLPTNTGMAFVLIQHLAPDRESLLSEILARETTMPVLEVLNDMAVEPNCVYVIPPNTKMEIEQGLLKLTPREQSRARVKPVDTFFLSLAADLGSKAIAVVLSGGDGDGSQGLEAVKEAGGITFAQSEDSAQVSSMPHTAVATGHVDFILDPQQIAVELANISRHPYIASPTPEKAVEVLGEGETAMQVIFSLLRAATRVNFTQYKHATLKRRISRRMALYKLENIDDYVTYLREHSAEVQALSEDMLIHVTSFFRDPLAFEALGTKVFPNIANQGADIPMRIWVAGCSTGEEAYSIAICLLEYLDNQPIQPQIQIYATDISDRAIDTARTGFYKHSAVAEVSAERLQRFFVPVDGGYRICKSIREMCVFARQNICSDPPFSKLDLISCRNVLIYLGAALQKKILPTFHYGLKPTGFLILGTSETTGDSSDLFTAVDKKQRIYARKLAPARLTIDLIADAHDASELVNPTPRDDPAWGDFDLQKEADRIVLERFAPVGVVIDNDLEILHFRGQTSLYLEPAPGRASHNLLKMAKDGLKLELRTAIYQAKQQNLAVRKDDLQITDGDLVRQINFEVIPLKARGMEERYFLVLFQAATPPTIARSTGLILSPGATRTSQSVTPSSEPEMARLNQELATTKEYLRTIIEEQEATNQDLRAANEEILSSNEEFQSSNEELETAKEEIQATNEELNTINDELQRRNHEVTEVSNDLENLIGSTNIPILMLGSDLCIRRFTPLAQTILHLIPTDVGRPLWDINHALNVTDLESQIREVINTLKTTEQEVKDRDGHWYDLRIRPYRTLDHKIDGAMLILIDIDALKLSMEQLEHSRNYVRAIVETVREPLIVLDGNLRISTANRSFYHTFEATIADTEQRLIFDLGNGQWNIPKLRGLLLEIIPTDSKLQDFEVEHDFEQIGNKTMLLNARKMTQSEGGDSILLAIEDITKRKRLEANTAFLTAIQDDFARLTTADEIMQTVGEKLSRYLDTSQCVFAEIDEAQERVTVEYNWHSIDALELASTYQLSEFVSAEFHRAARERETIVIGNTQTDARTDADRHAALNIHAFVSVPFHHGNNWKYMLTISDVRARDWREDEIELIDEVANRLFPRIERARAEATVAANLHDTQLLRELGARLVTEDDIHTLYREILAAAIDLTGADAGTFQILDARTQDLCMIASQGIESSMTERFARVDATSDTSCGIAINSGIRTFVDFDVPQHLDPYGSMRVHLEAGLLSAQSTPLISRTGKAIGMVSTHWRTRHRPSDRQLQFLDLLVRQAADLIEQRQTTEALREREEQLRLATAASKLGMWFWNLDTDTLTWTEQCRAMFGLPADTDMSYEIFTAALHPDDRQRTQEAVTRSIADRAEYDIEYRSCWPDGTIHWTAAKGSCTYDTTGTPTRMLGVAIDITERKQIEEALRASEAQLAEEVADMQQLQQISSQLIRKDNIDALYEQIVDAAIALMRSDTGSVQILDPDRHALRLLTWRGLDPAAVERWQWVNVDSTTSCGNTLLSGERTLIPDVEACDFLAGTADLDAFRLFGIAAAQSTPLISRNGRLVGMITTHWRTPHQPTDHSLRLLDVLARQVADLLDREQAEESLAERARQLADLNSRLARSEIQLQERNQELNSFVHIVSHDLKAPLRAVSNLSQWIEEDFEGAVSANTAEQMNLLRCRIYRMEGMIDGLLEYARVGRQDSQLELVAVADLLTEVIESIAPPPTFKLDIASGMPTLVANQLLLSQVFANLISNAFKHHDRSDGCIQVSSRELGEFYEFAICDDGPGIAPEHRERVFVIFQAANPQKNPDSTGIGLSIVKKIIETAGGRIWLESELGKGTTFYFTWPMRLASG